MFERLNLGCGEDVRSGYVNVDLRPLRGIDVIADIRELPFEPNSVAEIMALDVFEHVSFTESQRVLNHWRDLLMIGGVLYMKAPCLDAILPAFQKAQTTFEIEDLVRVLYGNHDYPENSHRNVLQSAVINRQMAEAGLEIQDMKIEDFNIIIRAIKN